MTRITHVLRDGTVKKDITGHIVKYEDAPALYQRLKEVNRWKSGEKSKGVKVGMP